MRSFRAHAPVLDCAFPVTGAVWSARSSGTPVRHHLDQLTSTVDPETLDGRRAAVPHRARRRGRRPSADATVADTVADAVEAQPRGGRRRRVGSITADIPRAGTTGSDRGVESSLGNLIADIQLWATSNESFGGEAAQIAIMNPGGVRADLLSAPTAW